MRQVYLNVGSYPEGFVLSQRKVITPNFQAARTLGVPPTTLQDLALTVLDGGLVVPHAFVANRLLLRAARECLSTEDPGGIARQIATSVRELLRSGVNPEILNGTDSPRAKRLAAVTQHYRELLAAKDLVDETALLWKAIEQGIAPQPLFICGYARLGLDGAAFVDAAAADGSVLLLPWVEGHRFFEENRQTADYLHDRGWTIEVQKCNLATIGERAAQSFLTSQPDPETEATVHADIESEVRATLGRVLLLLNEGVRPTDIALVASDLTLYGPVVLAIAWEYGVPLKALYPIRLDGTRPGAWIALLLACLRDDFPYYPTAALLCHPLAGVLSDEQWHQARREHPSDRAAWERLGIVLPDWERSLTQTPTQWHIQLRTALDFFQLAEKFTEPQERSVWEQFQLALDQLDFGSERINEAAFYEDMLELLAVTTTPAHPHPDGVELHPPLSVFGARFDHLFVMGAVEGQLPQSIADDPFLDFYERKSLVELGIPLDLAGTLAHREALTFHVVLQAAVRTLVLSCPKQIEGRAALPSRYFKRMGLRPERPTESLIASAEEYRRHFLTDPAARTDIMLETVRRAWQVETRREGTSPHDGHDGVFGLPVALEGRVFSATQIVALGQCPFKWFASHLLKLREPEGAEDDLSPSLRGLLYHRVLETAVEENLEAADQRQAILDALESAFVQAERRLKLIALVGWNLRRLEHLETLRRAVRAEDFLLPDARIVATEVKFEAEWRGLRVTGVIDRVDQTPDGLVLVDYKTGASPPVGAKNTEGKTSLDVQLPLYTEAAALALHPNEPITEAYYYSLSKARRLNRKQPESDTLQALVARVKGHLEAGSFPVEPDSAGESCTYCSYDGLCRRGPRLAHKGMRDDDT